MTTPTNASVTTFSAEEKMALSLFRKKLPDIVKSIGNDASPPQLWGVTLDKESKDERLDVILVKFLRARTLDVESASKMLSATLNWRKSYKTDHILDESFPDDIFKTVGYIHGRDRANRPVCYNVYGNLDVEKVFGNVDRFVRWRVQLMERGIRDGIDFVKVDSMLQVHDYEGVSMWGGRTPESKEATKQVIAIMQENYPEFLAKKYFINVPWWGSIIFKLIRPLLSEATVQKFVVCSAGDVKESLMLSIDEDNLPIQYGGKSVVPGMPQTDDSGKE